MNTLPASLNGYPVTAIQRHQNCCTVMCIRDPENAPDHRSLVVATWWPSLGDSWVWGHYINDTDSADAQAAAEGTFHEVAERNARR